MTASVDASAARSLAHDYYSQSSREVGTAVSSRPLSSGDTPCASVLASPSHHDAVTPLAGTFRLGRSPPLVSSQLCSRSRSSVYERRSSPQTHSSSVRKSVASSQGESYEGMSQRSKRSWSPSRTSSR